MTENHNTRGYVFTVEDVIHVAGKGWLHTGKVVSASEPATGEACVYGDSGLPQIVTVIGFERFAIPSWWRHSIGVLCRVRLPIGTAVSGNVKR